MPDFEKPHGENLAEEFRRRIEVYENELQKTEETEKTLATIANQLMEQSENIRKQVDEIETLRKSKYEGKSLSDRNGAENEKMMNQMMDLMHMINSLQDQAIDLQTKSVEFFDRKTKLIKTIVELHEQLTTESEQN